MYRFAISLNILADLLLPVIVPKIRTTAGRSTGLEIRNSEYVIIIIIIIKLRPLSNKSTGEGRAPTFLMKPNGRDHVYPSAEAQTSGNVHSLAPFVHFRGGPLHRPGRRTRFPPLPRVGCTRCDHGSRAWVLY